MHEFPNVGFTQIKVRFIKVKRTVVQRERIRASMKRVNPEGCNPAVFAFIHYQMAEILCERTSCFVAYGWQSQAYQVKNPCKNILGFSNFVNLCK